MRKNYPFASWLRAFAVLSILYCHLVAGAQSPLIRLTGAVFNIGVQIFVILSGFLFGTQFARAESARAESARAESARAESGGGGLSARSFYKRRARRIFIPYWLFLAVLALVWVAVGRARGLLSLRWLALIFGMQGSVVIVLGADHTWFITPILISYAITPLLHRLSLWLDHGRGKLALRAALLFTPLLLDPLLSALVPPAFLSTLSCPVVFYILAFFLGERFESVHIRRPHAALAAAGIILAFGARLVARHFIDGTIWYDRVIVQYTHGIAAFCIFTLFAYFLNRAAPPKAVRGINRVSFEIYLYHAMFTFGPLKLLGATGVWPLDCLLVIAATLALAIPANLLTTWVTKRIERRKPAPAPA